jgi:hypothetical protein
VKNAKRACEPTPTYFALLIGYVQLRQSTSRRLFLAGEINFYYVVVN